METQKKLKDSEILEQVLFALRVNKKQFSEELGYKSHMSIYYVGNETNRITQDMINRIIIRYPEVNPIFLQKGEGDPLRFKTQSKAEKFNHEKPIITIEQFASIPEKLNDIELKINEQSEILKKILSFYKNK
ncbi:hypothetical protein [Flavobacterium psychrophilum]|uniref:HTH cro/C1-type domain-containing protein n=1 Tax=Flavobacterium psychrophilum TaxID=96345 RepID=A0A7U2RAK1_FLAPS|nr:hypothetical protein [Flavobacterium psychrophilum]QRE03557.1 hypothetical protein H0H26_11805 [Flavobacterium psychrophilum]